MRRSAGRFTVVTVIFIVLIVLSTILIILTTEDTQNDAMIQVELRAAGRAVEETGDMAAAQQSLARLQSLLEESSESQFYTVWLVPSGLALIYVIICFIYIRNRILAPFDRLKLFAAEVAAGNLETPLLQERGLYFGDFTWAFDNMRTEIVAARKAEKESIENNKTVIATLSHDIKTPISSIRTYSEALEANLAKTPEKRSSYIRTIIDKCEEVAALTDDLFVHCVSDMDRMSVVPVRINLSEFMRSTIPTLNTFDNIKYEDSDGKVYVNADPARLVEICENIVGNSNKYARGPIAVSLSREDGRVLLTFRDWGAGIPEENLPFITQKFYRGSNAQDVPGSGLGLFIVGYLCTKMNLDLHIDNVYTDEVASGLCIKIYFDDVS